jgi:hypothetical protein
MNIKVRVGHGALVTLTDKHYKTAGGEASIYVNGGITYKLYHEPKKKCLPPAKLTELSKISNPQVVVPQNLLFDANTGDPVGYTTNWVTDAFPLIKFFTRTFKDDNNISFKMIIELVKALQLVVKDIHAASCLVVDLNELNVLVKINSALEPWMIDTDSYATPSFRATAIMDSVRDRRVSKKTGDHLHYDPDVLSDWFSFGVLAFWLYTNIHPYRGNHPSYKPKEKGKQMDDGISVFHKGVRVPPSVNDFNLIPRRHLDWFKSLFFSNNRSEPPLPDVSAPIVVPAAIVILKGTDKLEVIQWLSFGDTVMNAFYIQGITYVVTKTKVFANKNELVTHKHPKKMLLVAANDGTIVYAVCLGGRVTFHELLSQAEIGRTSGTEFFARNNCIYTAASGKLIENSFTTLSNKVVHRRTEVGNISAFTATVYDGCVIQDLLGKKYLTLPYKKGASWSKYLPQLDGFRIVEAKSEKTLTVVLAEHGGVFHRFIFVFDKEYRSFEVREAKDVAYDAINFTVTDSGLCLLLTSPTELELFTTAKQFETLSDPPFDSTMRLFSTPNGVFFVNGSSIHQVKRK